jgi:hypothetical protein
LKVLAPIKLALESLYSDQSSRNRERMNYCQLIYQKQAQMPQSGNIPPSWRRDGQGGRPLSVSTEGAGVGFINQNGRNPKI